MKNAVLLAIAAPLAAQQGVNFYSIEKEIALGNSLAAEFQRNSTVASDPRVDKLGAALVPPKSVFQYRFRTFEGGGYEAVVFPGGWVFVPQPLLTRDDRQLSAILAHGIAHIELRHGTRLMTRRELSEIGLRAAGAAGARPAPDALSLATLQRSFELAADLQAIQLLHGAGIDPASLVEYLRTLPAVDKPVFADHPTAQHRIDAAQKAIADLPQ